ncbi:MAG TPA: bifunctional [glutamine synthetase] adenylyltransferase/[glutamine synthetase]-adenylyl-L-tyrosine phosphorylase [Mycobacteriales bacterium]|nr:bifunctional [glutamine synthetase] adenylyltransferase/[glutamine synthetase]-adenylyl-L-tyrosine phosphorylase [Mycobacteriales bacterium]
METADRRGLRLARLGFADGGRAGLLLGPKPDGLDLWADPGAIDDGAAAIVSALGRAADPDLALLALSRFADPELLAALRADAVLRRRLVAVLGASSALGDHLAAYPQDWQLLTGTPQLPDLLAVVGADPADPPTGTAGTPARGNGDDVVTDLRVAYRRHLLVLAARDLAGEVGVDEVGSTLAELADRTLSAGLAVALAALRPAADPVRLSVIGMGKCGGRELNYVSDVDVIFVAEGALETATTLATELMRVCGRVAWPVDAALRPEGKMGPLVRTLASHEAYYTRWARTWEFQALLKARPVAGDPELGRSYVDTLAPLVWTAAEREHFVPDVQAMRRRVEDTLPPDLAAREIKLGPGGLRDVEFAVQLLQLVHGRADDALHVGGTVAAIKALGDGGYVGRDDALTLTASYHLLRGVEHRLQLQRLRRTHLVPDDDDGRRWVARAMGFRPDVRGDAVAVFDAEWALHAREVRRLHEKLFYRPLLHAVARVPSDQLRLSPEQAALRLSALGFADPDGALRHLSALTAGVSRRAVIQRTLLPVVLHELADAPDPDAGLLAYRTVSESLGDSPWYLRFLRDEGQVTERLAHLLGTSRYVAELLARAPEALRILGDDAELTPRPAAALRTSFRSAAARHEDAAAAVGAARELRRQELLRIAAADVLGLLDVAEVGEALTDVVAATVEAALGAAQRAVAVSRGVLPTRIAVIAMGRVGGAETGFGSDADVLFVHEPMPGAAEEDAGAAANAVVTELRRLLALPAADPPLQVDADLRPEGRNGPLVRTLSSYRAYYRRWSSPWEAQALLRACPLAGDAALGEAFIRLVDPLRYPDDGLTAAATTEIRRLKARMDAERLPRGADPATHTKLGRGGLVDVEWTVQLLQMRHGTSVPGLRTTRTLPALAAAREASLLSPDDTAALEAAWRIATRARNAVVLVRGRASDQLPGRGKDLDGVMQVAGYPPGRDPGQFLDDYRRATRRARAVVERVFYD